MPPIVRASDGKRVNPQLPLTLQIVRRLGGRTRIPPENRDSQLRDTLAPHPGMGEERRFVYVLKNTEQPPRYYTGLTSDVAERFATHNQNNGQWSARHRPWRIDFVIEFADAARAARFERYLKSGSGVAFAKRHLR